MENSSLQSFYETWSGKSEGEIRYDIQAAIRKADVISEGVSPDMWRGFQSILDFGCGYGALLSRLQQRLSGSLESAIGVDFSQAAIDVANRDFQRDGLNFYKLPSFDVSDNVELLRSLIPAGVDAILLVDLLEHVPDCKSLIGTLSEFTKFFIVKLPIEASVMSNYLLPKEYPSSAHSNGHLREFNANNVYYFIRTLGLTPLCEELYVYHQEDSFPPPPTNVTVKQKVSRVVMRAIKGILSILLPKKIFIRLVGDGGYYCVASFNRDHVLSP